MAWVSAASRALEPWYRALQQSNDIILRQAYASGLAGTGLVYFLALCRKTRFPRWLLFFLPTTLSLASDAFRGLFAMIPAPVGGIILGGWIKGSFVLFFAVATCVFWRLEADCDERLRGDFPTSPARA